MIVKEDIELLKKYFVQQGKKFTQAVQSIISWGNISGKPSTFTPSAHTHTVSDITDINEGLVGTKEVDEADIADNKILVYDSVSGKLIYEAKPTGSGGVLNKYDATVAPADTNDNTEGYSVGSIWIDEAHGNVYQAVNVDTNSAVWLQLNSVINNDAPSNGNTYGRKDGSWAQIISSLGLGSYLIYDDPNPIIETGFSFTVTVA